VNVFAEYQNRAWPIRFAGRLKFRDLVIGGTPTNPKVAAAWLKTKFSNNDAAIKKMIAEIMAERLIGLEESLTVVEDLKLLKGFKSDAAGPYLEGRVLKACLKEGVSVALAAKAIPAQGVYGAYKASGARNFVAEHVMVVENKLHMQVDGKPVTAPDDIQQRFVTTYKGTGITYEEYIAHAELDFTIITDWPFDDDFWGIVWSKACEQGLGATRSMGFGRFDVIRWDRLDPLPAQPVKKPAAKANSPKAFAAV
jgi:hypothetical protein